MLTRHLTHILRTSLCIGALINTAYPAMAEDNATPPEPTKRNVILIIGDGMDDHQITIARNYLKGAQGKLQLDELPLRSTAQILTVDESNPEKPIYVADSANTATSLATGIVTSRGRIATNAGDGQNLSTIAELAQASGYATGIVTTSSITDATPASFISHVTTRVCESPSLMQPSDDHPSWLDVSACADDKISNGGLGSIAQQIVTGNTDIVLGGGLKHFETLSESGSHGLIELAESNGYQVIKSLEELPNLASDKKALGLFASGTLPTIWQGEKGRSAEKPNPSLLNKVDWRLGSVELPEPMHCERNPEFGDTPALKQMTETALRHLSAQTGQGFFLMVESASIDKQSHSRNPCGSIGELEQLEEALESALAFAEKEPDTLILVTADHGQAAQLIPNHSIYGGSGVAVYSPGQIARIKTPENQIMAINYATTKDFPYEDHTGVNVPLFSNQQGVDRVPSMVTQPQIFNIMADYLNLLPETETP
ncbi:alkaline phosphatase [Pseudomaricurvus sp.]|uniref:alkaline phosphatase n=1 Tax=Pseudomaricurvus sp. TaxID=2004510 RepID=UPI003F6BD85E